MATITYEFLRSFTNKAGVTSYRWEPSKLLVAAGWAPLKLGKDKPKALTDCEARNAAVAAWRAGGAPPIAADITPARQAGTLAALIARYRREWVDGHDPLTGRRRIAASTAKGYATALVRLEEWAGADQLAAITPKRVGELRDTHGRPREAGGLGHAATLALLKQLRQLFAFAESCDLIATGANPATKFKLGAVPARDEVWEADDEGAFIAAAYALGMPSMALAIELAIYTAQREEDLIRWTEHQLAPLNIHEPALVARLGTGGIVTGWVMAQGKGGTPMGIALEPVILAKVQAAIRTNRARDRAAVPPRLLTYVLVDDATGRPWTMRAFIKAWHRVIDHAVTATGRAGMQGLVWHDLRRTRVVRMRRRGMHPATIAALTGHALKSIEMMLKVYGPIDPTSTAAAIASMLPELPRPAIAL